MMEGVTVSELYVHGIKIKDVSRKVKTSSK